MANILARARQLASRLTPDFLEEGLKKKLQQAELARIATKREGLRPKARRLQAAQAKIERLPVIGAAGRFSKLRGERAAKSIIGGLKTAEQRGPVSAGIAGLQIGYGLAQINPFSPVASLAMSAREPLLAGMLKSARTGAPLSRTLPSTLSDPYAGVGTTGLGLTGAIGTVADIALDPDLALGVLSRGGGKNVLKAIRAGVKDKKRIFTAPAELLISHEGAPDRARVNYYANKLFKGEKIKPIKIVREGARYGIEDGKHRFEAMKQLGVKNIPVELVEPGGKKVKYLKDTRGRFAGSEPVMGIAGKKERGFVKTVKKAPTTAKPVAEQIKGYYKPISNKKTLAEAIRYVDEQGLDVAKQKVVAEPPSALNNAIGMDLMRRAQDEGRFDEAIEIAEQLAVKGTESGQASQAFAMWGRLTPEGMLRYAQKELDSAQNNMGAISKWVRKVAGKGPEDFKLNQSDAKKITKWMQKAADTTNEKQKMNYAKKSLELVNQKTPWGVSDFLDEMRYNNMLSNPKSHMRNAYQNALNTLVTRPATLVAEGRPVEAAKYYGGVLTGIPDAMGDFVKTVRGKTKITKPDLKQVKMGKLPTVWQMPSRMMEGGDRFFSRLIKNGMKAAGYADEVAEQAAEYSLLRTPVNQKQQGAVLDGIDKFSRWLYKAPKPVRWFVPFVRTPMNAAKQWIEFSPAGLANIPGAANKRTQLAKTMVGSSMMLYGAYLAGENKVTWTAPTDQEEKSLFYASGRKPFSVQVGDRWVPMWYFGPMAAALAAPAAVKHYQEESKTALTDTEIDKLVNVTGGIIKFIAGQTPLSGLSTFVQLAEGDIDYSLPRNIAFASSQMIPFTGLLSYISKAIDPIYRRPLGFMETLKANIPGMSKEMEAYTEPTGEPSKRLSANLLAPYDIGVPKGEYEAKYTAKKVAAPRQYLIGKSKGIIKKGQLSNLPETLPDNERNYLVADHVYSKINSLSKSNVEGRRELYEQFKEQGYLTDEVMGLITKIGALSKSGLSKTDRELLLYDGDARAQKIIDRFFSIKDKKKKRQHFELLKHYGIITPEVEQAIARIGR